MLGGGEVSILPLTSPKSEIFVWRFYSKELSLEGVIKKKKLDVESKYRLVE